MSPYTLRQIRPWLEPVATVATLVAAIFAAVAAGHAAGSADNVELQTASLIGTSRPYLVVGAATLHISENNPGNFEGITLSVENAGKHPAQHPTIQFAVVDANFQLVGPPDVEAPAIDILGGRAANATFGPSSKVVLGSTYFVVGLSYWDPILGGEIYVDAHCFSYEPLATDTSRPTVASCTHDEYARTADAAFEFDDASNND
jgi:hypothetical protein